VISSNSACENGPPAQLFERTRMFAAPDGNAAFTWMANSIAFTASASVPVPLADRNLSPIMLANQLMPVTPTPLFPTAPIVPATCVPWK
jgi:hypothetical protein